MLGLTFVAEDAGLKSTEPKIPIFFSHVQENVNTHLDNRYDDLATMST